MTFKTFRTSALGAAIATAVFALSGANAAPVNISVNGTFTHAPDSLTVGSNVLSGLVGLNYTATFSFDTAGGTINDEFASPASGGTGEELGREFTGGFVTPLVPALPGPDNTFTSPTLIVEQENNVTRSAAELLNLLPGGTFDFYSMNGWEPSSTFSGGSTIGDGGAIDGVTFGLTFIDVDATMIGGPLTPGSIMPSSLDLSLVDFVVITVEEIEDGDTVGFAYQFGTIGAGGTFNEFTIVSETTVAASEPGMAALFALTLGALGLARRKKQAS